MSRQPADGEATQDLPRLLDDILADLESALNSARNQPARKLLQARIDRLRGAQLPSRLHEVLLTSPFETALRLPG